MAKTATEARRPDATAGTDAIYRSLFDSFNPDSGGRISPLEVLSRLERSGLRPDDPRIADALAGLAGAGGGTRQISFAQFKAQPPALDRILTPRHCAVCRSIPC